MTKTEKIKDNLSEIKEKMKSYTDFFGGEFIDKKAIDEAETLSDLEQLFQNHHDFITDMATDAQSHLDHFKRSLKIDKI